MRRHNITDRLIVDLDMIIARVDSDIDPDDELEDSGIYDADLMYDAVVYPTPVVFLSTKSFDARKVMQAALDLGCAWWELYAGDEDLNLDVERRIHDFVTQIAKLRQGGAEMHQVESTNLHEVGYDPANQYLFVEFKNGSKYMYFDVPVGTLENLFRAQSPGRFLNEQVKPKHKYTPLP
jgi:hypothetical protein